MDAGQERDMDRRDFLKGAALFGAGTMGAGALVACSPGTGGDDATTGDSSAGTEATVKPVAGTVTPEDWLGTQPDFSDAEEGGTYDVIVLGGGHAGTQAALGAAQKGARVAVFEQQPQDTYSYFGDDICSYNSQFMIARGFGPYETGEIVSEFVRRGCGRVSPVIIKRFVENSGEMMDNMVSLVPETSTIFDYGQCIVQIARGKDKGTDYPIVDGGYKAWATTIQTVGTTNPTPVQTAFGERTGMSRLTEIESYVMKEAIDKGAEWFFGHKAVGLVIDGDAVKGAYVEDESGTVRKYLSNKGVLLSCGDFSGNADMIYNLLDDVNEWNVRAGADRSEMTGFGRDGMGHKLGCWAGGAIEPHPRPSMNSNGAPGPFGSVPMLILNSKGQRFFNENMAQVEYNQILRQHPGITALVTDSKYMQSIESVGIDHGAPNWGAPANIAKLDEDIKAMAAGPEGGSIQQIAIVNVSMGSRVDGYVAPPASEEEGEGEAIGMAPPGGGGSNLWKGETLEETLGYVGYSGEALQTALNEIEHYNELCYSGVDSDFGKEAKAMIPIDEGPFYACFGTYDGRCSAGLVTLTGLLTDENLNVLKADRSGPIKGLYAAGNCLGQRYGVGYSTPAAGNSMGMAMTHGRFAGQVIASL